MSPESIGLIGLAIFFVLMFLGIPVGVVMALVGFAGFAAITHFEGALTMIGMVPYSTIASYTFSVLPVFMLMGDIMARSGIMNDAFNGLNEMTRRVKGGLGMAAVGGCAMFAAACGSSTATAVTMCKVSLPQMLKHDYAPSLATGTIAAGGTLGILIPPSLPMIVYALIAEVSVGKLYMAGIVPGIVLSAMFIGLIWLQVRLKPSLAPRTSAMERRSIWRTLALLKDIWSVGLLSLLILGGIWVGIFTPTEAGAVGVIGALIILAVRREFNMKLVAKSLVATLSTVGMILTILIGAMIFNYFMAVSKLPMALANLITDWNLGGTSTVLIMIGAYIILGMFLDAGSMTLLTIPIFCPALAVLGVDLVWFGVIVVVMTELALITPPVGMHCWVIHGMARQSKFNISLGEVFKGSLPFVITMLVFVGILILIPALALWLPDLMR